MCIYFFAREFQVCGYLRSVYRHNHSVFIYFARFCYHNWFVCLLSTKQSNMVEKFAQKKPTCIAYDEKLQFYSNLVIEVLR